MAPHFSSDDSVPVNTIAVAIDKDKNAPHAVRCAIDHLVITNPFIILIHVRHKNRSADERESDYDINQLFIPYRGYCACKGIQMKEVTLEDGDISKALLDYVSRNLINSIVLGAATRNAFSRKFKNDIPTSVIKTASEFCSVYVISKGKVFTMRKAQRIVSNTAIPPKAPSGKPPQIPLDQTEDDGNRWERGHYAREALRNAGPGRLSLDNPPKVPIRNRVRHRSSPANLSLDSIDLAVQGQSSTSHDSLYSDLDFPTTLALGSMDISDQNLDFSVVSSTPSESLPQNSRDIEDEMRRLKLELKQTMDMYSTACKEALAAKRKADELHQWKIKEARKFEEARPAGEAALALAEIEKAKSKAAIEAAEAAQRLAEMEAHRRRQAEYKAMKEAKEKNRL